MIVYTMDEKELIKEVELDYFKVFNYSERLDNKWRRLVIKSRRFPVKTNTLYESPKKNKWILLFEARNKKEIGDMSRVTFVCYYNSPHGYYAIMPTFTNGKHHFIIYPPHFFSRFAKRCKIELSGVALIRNFFIENSTYVYDVQDKQINENTYRKEVYGTTKDGIALGFMSVNNNVLFKTFITYEMTKGEQIEKFANNEKIRQEIHEDLR